MGHKLLISHISKTFTARRSPMKVLDDINLQIEEGEFMCLLGPSGCGKSTLLNIVAGLETPSEGQVQLDGMPVKGPGPDRGVVFQQYALFPWLTVRGNVEFGLRLKKISREERNRIVERVLNLVGLQEFRDAWPKELSGGMKQRVAIARAYALDPMVLLMDEPFGALDALTRTQLQDNLAETWHAQQKTVLFVTHDVDEAIFLGTRVVVFSPRPGRVMEILPVILPTPRKAEARNSKAFWEYRQELSDMVKQTSADSRAGERGVRPSPAKTSL